MRCEQVMQSTKFLTEDARNECVCCGQTSFDSGVCANCQAPLELSRTVRTRGKPPRFVSVLGASGAGKTVYLGFLLDILSKGARNVRGLPNNSFSVAVQEQTISALEQRRFPEKTASEADHWSWVHFEVRNAKKSRQYFDIVTPDLAGEAIGIEVDHPGTYPAIHSMVEQSRAILVLFDSVHVRDSGREEDVFALKLASYIHNLRMHGADPKRKQKDDLRIAIVFTKSDWCPEARNDPAEFAAEHMPGLIQYCEQSLANHAFFAASVVGSSATMIDRYGCEAQIPFHIEPHGILEPLEWIMQGGWN